MSITFRPNTPHETLPSKPCGCGATGFERPTAAQENCRLCLGYGPDPIENPLDLNMANGNAGWLLREVLGVSDEEASEGMGSMDASTLAVKISCFWNAEAGVVESSEDQAEILSADGVSLGCRVFHGGRSLEQVERYLEHLKAICEAAEEAGVSVVWG